MPARANCAINPALLRARWSTVRRPVRNCSCSSNATAGLRAQADRYPYSRLMPLGRRGRVKVELKLPLITVGTDDVGALFKRGEDAGPFAVTSRACGLALDTGLGSDNGTRPLLWPPHARRHQLWYFRPSGHKGEVLIISAESGLALDAETSGNPGRNPVLWEPHGEAWQRWTLQQAPDGIGHIIGTVAGGHVLESREEAERSEQPWLAPRDAGWAQQWVLAMPHGSDAR